MKALMFDIKIGENQYYYPRKEIQNKIEELENVFSKLNNVYYKIDKPKEIIEEGKKVYVSQCTVINQNKKYNWDDIKNKINIIYKGNYEFKSIKNNIKEFKKIKFERKNNIKILCASLIASTKNIETFSVGFILDGKKDIVYINKLALNNVTKWELDKTNDIILNKKQQNELINTIKNDPPNDFKSNQYIKNEIEVIEDLSKISFEEEIEIEDINKVNLYFANAYYLFLTPLEDYKYNYYDGYLELNLKEKTSRIEIVVISDDDERIYYDYIPNEEETLELINAAEKYCQETERKSLRELIEEVEEEEKKELY